MKKEHNCKEPYVRIAKRGVVLPFWKSMGIRAIALAAALPAVLVIYKSTRNFVVLNTNLCIYLCKQV